MIDYKYKKKENKFTENGHTMFEEDVLQRLKRLADLEEQIKQGQLLPIDSVSNSLEQTIYVTNSCPNDVYAAFDNESRGSIEAEESGCYTTKIKLYKGERI
jgi:uncharacterized ParB-like nuclease family protein